MAFTLKEIPAGGGAPDNGQYQVKFNDVEPGVTQAGDRRVTLKGESNEGRKFFVSRLVTEKMLWKLRDDLNAAGVDDDYKFQGHPIDDFTTFVQDLKGIFVGKSFDIKVEDSAPSKKDGKVYKEYSILGRASFAGARAYDTV